MQDTEVVGPSLRVQISDSPMFFPSWIKAQRSVQRQTARAASGLPVCNRLLGILDYLFDASNKKSLLIGIYFDAELISEVDVNLGTP